MGQPKSTETNRAAALAFAQMITQSTGATGDQIARRGNCSIFAVLLAVCPSLVRGAHGINVKGLSEIEFIKMLQVVCKATAFICWIRFISHFHFFKQICTR